jgi:hypothetical protein
MSGVRSPDGLVHVIHVGSSNDDVLYALCDVVDMDTQPRSGIWDDMFNRREPHLPDRRWTSQGIVDEVPSCLRCIVAVREAIGV